MGTVSGLTKAQRILCRERVIQAAELAYDNRDTVHYTQDGRRWNGMRNNRDAALGKFPHWADCSSFATWCLWNGMFLKYGLEDTVNGSGWSSGFTGTLLSHGQKLTDHDKAIRGDLVFYADPTHVTVVAGRDANQKLMVYSHGSEKGPWYLKHDFRTVTQIRRYI